MATVETDEEKEKKFEEQKLVEVTPEPEKPLLND